MKIRIERDVLADGAAWVVRALPARPPVPVLGGVLIEASEDRVSLSTFDYETAAHVELGATVGEPGRVLVSCRLLADIVKSLPARPVDVVSDGSRVTIVCGPARFSLPTMPVEDYPALPALPSLAGTVAADVLAVAVQAVGVAAGKDGLPMLTGIRMEVAGARLTLAATDRFRLAIRELDWAPAEGMGDSAVVIPARALVEAAKHLGSSGTVQVFMEPDGGTIGFAGGGRQATTRLLAAEFPRFRQLIPAEHTTAATVDVAALVAAVKRVALVADRVAQVRLRFDGDLLTLSAGGEDVGDAEETVDATIEGPGIVIAFNPGYLLDALGALDAPRAWLTMGANPNRPVLVRSDRAGEDDARDSDIALLMPVRLAGS